MFMRGKHHKSESQTAVSIISFYEESVAIIYDYMTRTLRQRYLGIYKNSEQKEKMRKRLGMNRHSSAF